MAADAGEQPLPKGRLEKLAELSEEEFERLLNRPRGVMISRRQLIASLVAAGVGWGTIQTVLADASSSDSQGDVGTDSNPIDVFAEGLNSTTYVRPGDNIQTKIDQTPPGGRLVFLPGDHDIANVGTGTVDKSMTIEFAAGERSAYQPVGARLVNTGSDAVDQPLLTLTDTSAGDRNYQTQIIRPTASHDGNSPVLDIQQPWTHVYHPTLDLGGNGAYGIQLNSNGWGFKMYGGRINNPTQVGLQDNATGAAKLVVGTQFLFGSVGIEAMEGMRVLGCDFSSDTGIQIVDFRNYILGARFEDYSKGVVVGPSSKVGSTINKNRIGPCEFLPPDDVCIEFDHASNTIADPPITMDDGSNSGEAVRFTSNSSSNIMLVNRINAQQQTFTDNGDRNAVDFLGMPAMHNNDRSAINSPHEPMVFYNTDDGNLNIYDGAGWILPDGTST